MKEDPLYLRQKFTDKVLSHDYSTGPLLILAGPGTGKTFSLTETVRNQIKERLKLNEFYVTTFTNAAAGDFEAKVRYPINISTLHFKAKGIVHKYADKVKLSKSFKIINEYEIKVILKDIQRGLSSQRIKIKAKEVKEMLDRYREASARNSSILNSFFKYYWRLKRIYNAIDWFDVIYLAGKILKENKNIGEKESSKQSFILVDEYQDLNSADQDLIRLLCGNHSKLLVVGDDDQSIYSSRYANPLGIVNFKELYPKAEKIILPVCSRCPTAVLKSAHNLIDKNDKQNREVKPELIALPETDKKTSGGYVTSVKLKSAKSEAEFIGKALKTITNLDKVAARDIMVLCANRNLGIELMNTIRQNYPNIPIQDNLSKKDEDTKQNLIISYLNRFLSDNSDNLALRMILALLIDISSREILIILDEAQKNHTNLWETLQSENMLIQLKDKSGNLEKFIRYVKIMKGKSLNDKLSIFAQKYPDLNEPIQQWVEKHKKSELEITDEKPRSIPPASSEGVQFMTMHHAKGLQAKYVFIPFLERETRVPAKDIEEQRRLLYVAITRAKVFVIMTWAWGRRSKSRHKAGGGGYINRHRSNFIKECGIVKDTPEDKVLIVIRELSTPNKKIKQTKFMNYTGRNHE